MQGEQERPSSSPTGRRLLAAAFFLSAAVGTIYLVPFLRWGVFSGHDMHFHASSWLEVSQQWSHGIWMPRWADGAHFGLGEPRFVFYPPVSWLLGGALASLFPVSVACGAYVWISVLIACLSMNLLATVWLSPRSALIAAFVYGLCPYTLVNIFVRSAHAELLASSFFPLALFFCLRLHRERRATVGFAAILALIWLTNIPAGIITLYTTCLILVLQSIQKRTAQPLLRGMIGILLGLGSAAFFLLPAFFERQWINSSAVLRLDFHHRVLSLFQSNSVVSNARILAFTQFSQIGLALMGGAVLLYLKSPGLLLPGVLTAIAVFMTSAFSLPVWDFFSFLPYLQFPFRWLFVMNVALALILGTISGRFSPRALARIVIISWILLLCLAATFPRRSQFREETQLPHSIDNGAGYQSVPEYLAHGVQDSFEDSVHDRQLLSHEVPDEKLRLLTRDGDDQIQQLPRNGTTLSVLRWTPREKTFWVITPVPAVLWVRMTFFPSWRAQLNGQAVDTSAQPGTGLMLIAVPDGSSTIILRFESGPVYRWGLLISVVNLILLALLFARGSAVKG